MKLIAIKLKKTFETNYFKKLSDHFNGNMTKSLKLVGWTNTLI